MIGEKACALISGILADFHVTISHTFLGVINPTSLRVDDLAQWERDLLGIGIEDNLPDPEDSDVVPSILDFLDRLPNQREEIPDNLRTIVLQSTCGTKHETRKPPGTHLRHFLQNGFRWTKVKQCPKRYGRC